MPMIKVVMLVPVRDNEGRTFTKTEWARLERRLAAEFGGYSLLPGRVTGGWEHEGQLFRDQSRQYAVALDSWLGLSKWLETVLWARVEFRQAAMFIEVNGVPEILYGE